MQKSKGMIQGILIAVVLVLLGVMLYYGASYFSTVTKTELIKQQSIVGGGTGLAVVTGAGTGGTSGQTTGIYSYIGSKPYVNFYTEDASGTATSPTYYIYEKDPRTLAGGEDWTDERAWSDSSGTYWATATASSGKLQKQIESGKCLWIHMSISSYEDVFVNNYCVATRGDQTPDAVQDTNSGINAGTYRTIQYDTTVWTSSAIDLGVLTSANRTAYEHIVDTNYIVAKNKKVHLSELIMNVTKYDASVAPAGVKKIVVEIGGNQFTIYDYNAGIDKTSYYSSGTLVGNVFDSNNWPDIKNRLKESTFNQDQAGTLRLHYYADTNTVPQVGYISNGNVTGRLILVDMEGNQLIAQNVQG